MDFHEQALRIMADLAHESGTDQIEGLDGTPPGWTDDDGETALREAWQHAETHGWSTDEEDRQAAFERALVDGGDVMPTLQARAIFNLPPFC